MNTEARKKILAVIVADAINFPDFAFERWLSASKLIQDHTDKRWPLDEYTVGNFLRLLRNYESKRGHDGFDEAAQVSRETVGGICVGEAIDAYNRARQVA